MDRGRVEMRVAQLLVVSWITCINLWYYGQISGLVVGFLRRTVWGGR